MSTDSIKSLRGAVFNVLQSDTALLGLTSGIYEYRGQTVTYPYVYLDIMLAKEWSKLASSGADIEFAVQVVTQDKDSGACGSILARIQTLLHHSRPTVSDFTVHYIRWLDTKFLESKSPHTFEGISRFIARLVEA